MSASVTFTIAGKDAEKLKQVIQEKAVQNGLSVSEWITETVVERLRNEKNISNG
jgi:chromosomal replication initiation ATPase DnaA